ncbi:hypothetical protein LEP1GSC048_2393 [Leptospira santarosai serovar Shermani str. 1342KT]|nr:hypothetical protein LEP1GSC048_2393 [Leptospira santarosai serovar Shermani str. 1342KT]
MELAFAYFMRRDGAPKDERRRGVRAEISIRKKIRFRLEPVLNRILIFQI